MNARPILLQMKYARVIECFSEKVNITLAEELADEYTGSRGK